MYVKDSPSYTKESNTLESDRPHNDRNAACVIAQQHSSVTVVCFRFRPSKEKF
jgi:hypothetical protein